MACCSNASIMKVYGAIVRDLELVLRSTGKTQKAQAIDLAVVGDLNVDLFEVKTSAGTTDVYTGVGQLIIHGECIKVQLGRPVKRYLVIPEELRDSHRKAISENSGINVVTYLKQGLKYQFTGLNLHSPAK